MVDGFWLIYRRVFHFSFLYERSLFHPKCNKVPTFPNLSLFFRLANKCIMTKGRCMTWLSGDKNGSQLLWKPGPQKLLASFRNVGHYLLPLAWLSVELVIDTRNASLVLFFLSQASYNGFHVNDLQSLLRNRKQMYALKAKTPGRKIFTSGFWL